MLAVLAAVVVAPPAPRLPDGAVYCFYTLNPVHKVQAFVKGAGKPRNGGVSVSVREDVVKKSQETVDKLRGLFGH